MMARKNQKRIQQLVNAIPSLTEGQIYWLDKAVQVFKSSYRFDILSSDLFDKTTLENFGDALRIHHCFSMEPFSKDKFEYVLEKVLKMSGHQAALAAKGNRGHDITINGSPVSLKTQANKDIRKNKIWISKFMELGKGKWGDDPKDLVGLRKMFLEHLKGYERILILRALERTARRWRYELVEIPKSLMKSAKKGELDMKMEGKNSPKSGYCYVRTTKGENIYQLYFDGGSERKLQVQHLLKSYCKVHATWEFSIPPE